MCVFKHFVQLEFQVSTWFKCWHIVLSGVYNFLSSDKRLYSVSALKEQQKDAAKFQAELTNIRSVLKMNLYFEHVTWKLNWVQKFTNQNGDNYPNV